MPTILLMLGWRVFFYSNENNEPIHVHAKKGSAECKFWLKPEVYDIEEAWSHDLTPAMRREIRKIILNNFDLIVAEWDRHFRGRDHADN